MPPSFMTRLRRVFRPKKRHPDEIKICYASGLPKTHPLLINHVIGMKGYVNNKSTYTKYGEVDLKELLHAARRDLYERGVELGGNAIIRESWTCVVKDLHGTLTIRIRYRGLAGVCDRPDPHVPVAIEETDTTEHDEEGYESGLAQPRMIYSDDEFGSTTNSFTM